MNWLDITLLAVGGFVALAGWRMGAIQVAVSGAGILVGIALSSRLHGEAEPIISRFTDSENAAEFGGFALIFVLVLIASLLVGHALRAVLNRLMLGWGDKLAGVALGIVVTFAAGSAVFSAVQSYPFLGLDQTIEESTLGSLLADNFDTVLKGLGFIPDDLGA